ncbi:MAG: hypothetical protein NZX11_01950 [Thermus sp.]|nr:hypothetical protein [Thermus sp.]MCS6867495.1 hypothetical protein [Thermus sp.]
MEGPKRVKPYRKPEGERRGLLLVYTGEFRHLLEAHLAHANHPTLLCLGSALAK